MYRLKMSALAAGAAGARSDIRCRTDQMEPAERLPERQSAPREHQRVRQGRLRRRPAASCMITVHPGASLFKGPEIKRAVATGQAQTGEILISILENENPIFGIDVVPFLATVVPGGEEALARLASRLSSRSSTRRACMVLFTVPWGPQGIYAKKDLNTIEDMKGLKWRAYNVGTARIGELVGAQAVTVQAAELPQALATGVVNAFMSSGATGYDSKVWETLTHFYDTRPGFRSNVTIDQQGGVRLARQADAGGGAEGRRSRRGARLEDLGEQDRVVPRGDRQARHEGAEAQPGAGRRASRRSANSSPPTGSSGRPGRPGGGRHLQENVGRAAVAAPEACRRQAADAGPARHVRGSHAMDAARQAPAVAPGPSVAGGRARRHGMMIASHRS